jgi:hypothetical protein
MGTPSGCIPGYITGNHPKLKYKQFGPAAILLPAGLYAVPVSWWAKAVHEEPNLGFHAADPLSEAMQETHNGAAPSM